MSAGNIFGKTKQKGSFVLLTFNQSRYKKYENKRIQIAFDEELNTIKLKTYQSDKKFSYILQEGNKTNCHLK